VTIVFSYYDLVKDLQAVITGRLNAETICLYRGDHTPGSGDSTFFYLANEANFGGYARYPLTFIPAVLSADSVAVTQSQIVEWATTSTVNLPQVIGGVFALDYLGNLAWAELLPVGSVTLTMVGQAIPYQAVIEQGK
jgi:hypothetical protein